MRKYPRRIGRDTSGDNKGKRSNPGKQPEEMDLARWHRQVIADCERGLELLKCGSCGSIGFKKTSTGCHFCENPDV